MTIVKPISRMELKAIISRSIKLFGPDCDLNRLDTSDITNMSNIFENIKFNGDISLWNTSKVTNMDHMFAYSVFNGNIGSWDVSSVTSMSLMFQRSSFNLNISKWDVSNVMTMSFMFDSNWNINPRCSIECMFDNCNIIDEYKPKNIKNKYKKYNLIYVFIL